MRTKLLQACLLMVTMVAFGAVSVSAAPETTGEKRKCDELLKNTQDASPDLFTEILNCELNLDDETFAAAGGLGFDTIDPSQQLITGGDITLNSFDGGPGDGGPGDDDPPKPTCGAGTGVACPRIPPK